MDVLCTWFYTCLIRIVNFVLLVSCSPPPPPTRRWKQITLHRPASSQICEYNLLTWTTDLYFPDLGLVNYSYRRMIHIISQNQIVSMTPVTRTYTTSIYSEECQIICGPKRLNENVLNISLIHTQSTHSLALLVCMFGCLLSNLHGYTKISNSVQEIDLDVIM